jgi:hypothetical protein
MARILLVGEDPNLLATRSLLLSEWETETCRTSEAKAALNSIRFDGVILGQLVNRQSARELIALAKSVDARVLLVRYPGEAQGYDSETHILDLDESPSWLIGWARHTFGGNSHIGGKGTNRDRNPDGGVDPSQGSLETSAS